MNKNLAHILLNEIQGKKIGGRTVLELINFGGAGAVFSVDEDDTEVIKIIDPDLVIEFGEEEQIERLNREKLLVGHQHDNVVNIIDTGKCLDTGYLYIVMERLIGFSSLKSLLSSIPKNNIAKYATQLASAAEWLEDLEICHRDIKPENIMVSADFSKIKLMDLGIVSYFGSVNTEKSDPSGERFIGTARYCPSEFVRNKLGQDIESLRALTFYQIGCVLHDIIMLKPIFNEIQQTYAGLLDAIDNDMPIVESDEAPAYLIHLARDCLCKDPKERLKLVTWDRFGPNRLGKSQEARERVRQASFKDKSNNAPFEAFIKPSRSYLDTVGKHLRSQIYHVCQSNEGLYSPDIDINIQDSFAEVSCQFPARSSSSIYKSFIINFIVAPNGTDANTLLVDANMTWYPKQDNLNKNVRVGIMRSPDDPLTDELEDFIYRAFSTALNQPEESSSLALKME